MQMFRKGRSRLLGTLQVRSENLLDVRIGKRTRETFRATVSGIAKRSIRFVGNFIRVAHKKNGAHVLSVRTLTYR